MGVFIRLFYALPSLFFFLIPLTTSAFFKYDSSFAFLNVHSKSLSSSEGLDFCVSFQQWHIRQLPESAGTKHFVQIGWWNRSLNTDICLENEHNFAKNELVPADYRTQGAELLPCKFRQDEAVINGTVNRLKRKRVRNVLFLVEKGKRNRYGSRDFLFSQFYNPEINDSDSSMSVFFIYNDTFQRQIKSLLSNSSVAAELRFYRPQSAFPIDPAVVVLWLFAVGSILIGSLWAAFECKAKLGRQLPFDSRADLAQMSMCQHLSVVLFTLLFVVIVLTLAYFFRKIAVLCFCVLFWFFGIYSVHTCVYALFKRGFGEKKLPSLRQFYGGQKKELSQTENEMGNGNEAATQMHSTNTVISPQATNAAFVSLPDAPHSQSSSRSPSVSQLPLTTPSLTPTQKSFVSFLDRPIHLLSSIVFLFALLLSTVWFVWREHYNAFYLLDTINIMVCIFAVKASGVRSLRLLTFLMLAMFVYDLFMVFGTTLLTADGCSVMMQLLFWVVTGMDCQQKKAKSASAAGKPHPPVAPVNLQDVPEKIPLLFYMPMLADPMGRCFDVQVEREYKRMMLGLGDVIIPGYLIAYCFYVDMVKQSRFYTYGLISLIGYSLGMFSTFFVLLLMETGQPALIYLVPFTLVPVFVWAFFVDGNGILGKMWRGEI